MAENIELIRPTSHNYGATNNYNTTMKNGLQVDFVLVYKNPRENDAASMEEEDNFDMRVTFEQNLEKTGLILEHVQGKFSGGEDFVFVLIHAPWEFLCEYAEKMMIRVPISEPNAKLEESSQMRKFKKATSYLNPFLVKPSLFREEKKYVTMFFHKEYLSSFLIEDKATFFDNNDRSRMVKFVLNSTRYSTALEDFGIDRLVHNGVYTDCYRLHEGPLITEEGQVPESSRQKLQWSWARFGRWYKFQPLNAIKRYFGIRVGLYFAWLGTYNFMLMFAAAVGLLCFIYGIATMNNFIPALETCNKNNTRHFYMCPQCDKVCSYWTLVSICLYAKVSHLFDNGATVFFAVFMAFWTTVFLEVWKRKQITLSYNWDMLEYKEDVQPPRPAFVAKVKRMRPNPITGKLEPYLPRFTQIRRSACSVSVIVFMVVLVLAALVGVVIYRAAMEAILAAQSEDIIQSKTLLITAATASLLNLLAITVMSKIYWQLAIFLTNWENPRTQREYIDNLTVKMFMFEFINYYSSLFYIAFFKGSLVIGYPGHYNRIGNFRQQGCSPSGCLLELSIQLAVIMIGKQAINLFIEYALPLFSKWWKRRKEKLNKQEKSLPRWEKDCLSNEEPSFRLFHQYLDMVIQFGFVTMFVAAFPLAPLFALINNAFELRVDAINFVKNFRRPVGERAQTIGVWMDILLALSKIAVLVNAFVIAFTSEFIPREVYRFVYSADETLTGYVNSSLSYFKVSDFPSESLPLNPFANLPFNRTFCRFKGYHEPYEPYRFSRHFFLLMTVRLIFVLVFQYFVFFSVGVLAWIIPDVPYSLQIKIKREDYIAKEKLAQRQLESAKP